MRFTIDMDERLPDIVMKTFAELSSQVCFRLWLILADSLPDCLKLENITITWKNEETHDGLSEDLVANIVFCTNLTLGSCIEASLLIKTKYYYNDGLVVTQIHNLSDDCHIEVKKKIEFDMNDPGRTAATDQIKSSVIKAVESFLNELGGVIGVEREFCRLAVDFPNN